MVNEGEFSYIGDLEVNQWLTYGSKQHVNVGQFSCELMVDLWLQTTG